MSVELQQSMYAIVYATWGIPATLTTASGTEIELTAKNETIPSTINGFGVDFQAFKPSAKIRVSELPADLVMEEEIKDGTILMSDKTWSIKSFEYVPSPNGIADGEMKLFLKDDLDV